MAESKEELKSLLMKMKEEREKASSNLNIQTMKIITSGPITPCLIGMETMADFIFFGSKIIADGDDSRGIKRCLFLGRKAMTNLKSILKSMNIILSTKVHLVTAMFFPLVLCGCEIWDTKKAEHLNLMLLNYRVGEDLRVSCDQRR